LEVRLNLENGNKQTDGRAALARLAINFYDLLTIHSLKIFVTTKALMKP
jgi:hypothetical protein